MGIKKCMVGMIALAVAHLSSNARLLVGCHHPWLWFNNNIMCVNMNIAQSCRVVTAITWSTWWVCCWCFQGFSCKLHHVNYTNTMMFNCFELLENWTPLTELHIPPAFSQNPIERMVEIAWNPLFRISVSTNGLAFLSRPVMTGDNSASPGLDQCINRGNNKCWKIMWQPTSYVWREDSQKWWAARLIGLQLLFARCRV